MTKSRKLVAIASVIAAAGAASAGIAVASGGDDRPRGGQLERAKNAALAHTAGGDVTEAEVAGDGDAYEVVVRLADGRQLEVQLDDAFRVTGQEADDDGPADDDGAGDD